MLVQEILTKLGIVGETEKSTTFVSLNREIFTIVCSRLSNEFTLRMAVLYATDNRQSNHSFGLHAVFSLDETGEWLQISTALPESDPTYESLTKTIMSAHWYERYAMDMFGIVAIGHPDPRRLVHHENIPLNTFPLRKDFAWNTKLKHANTIYPMHHVTGAEGIYEIPVGPIHAGIIEPGHFRFNVIGERIITLEGKLFFTHKGIEKILENKSPIEALPFIEKISGDMAISHTLAFSQAIESISDIKISPRARQLRTLLNEIERITMHIFDISNICGMGTGFTVIASQGFKIKERLMRLSQEVCGNRFWRGLIIPGGLSRDLSSTELDNIQMTINKANDDLQNLIKICHDNDGLRERLETTGILKKEAALAYGAVGLTARASGIDIDVRRDHPYASYAELKPKIIMLEIGDVYSRFKMRYRELKVSTAMINQIIKTIKKDNISSTNKNNDGLGISAVESCRGEIITIVQIKNGVIERCVVRDPSFCNWPLFGEIGPGNIVPDFPLCNKSLNLSYSGNDM
ncbi:NADH-quinone oxidoreductase subunit F [Candidatus Uhrbacteria bacterium CG_4_9_14_0_2_um_filter_41_50]|uniref:NADH-quinone oxidoreductase subunit F n=1 Tax=Candidatus Uhrbacteria bacterium CG_4_9_14_0_2_um_filter_41_50 TaxID=1975031 RepID=A0A2M8EPA3_9BACT|nr:MAG: NADH-quinone oxidoreductase subunit F [Candidatus Uhrbacteria bacterium CG_4_10_14_0_2_um_filter_41_21]PJC24497.1 MAG: NADH-quinone oxidoreductase subunit F [Candidatus Uhrbacteria bacterium CG_4_9_14_0_2_um_filter_41_50]PJE74723.1 MAG: NADH-quinone oxidoreductase subunit F [Candidatus Uhrbacteria bacterium CG10_big_fil_rev_8_21_14_0_10_41_26]